MICYTIKAVCFASFLFIPNLFGAPKKKIVIPDHVKVIKDITYHHVKGKDLLMDLYLPKSKEKTTPIVIWVHGGGWKNGSKDRLKGSWLLNHGYAIASINYRLTHEAQWPAQINDCRTAVRFLRTNATKYNLDPKRFVAWGGSAGGHLVAVLGTQDLPSKELVSSKVQAVIDWYGPSDLLTMPPNVVSETRTLEQVSNSNGAKLLGATVRDVPHLAKNASAYWNVSQDDSTFLIMHGEKDPGVPLVQSTKFHEKLLENGVKSKLHIVKDAGHGGPLFQTKEVQNVMVKFLKENLN